MLRLLQAVICVSEGKNLTPSDEMNIYDVKDTGCVARFTTGTNMQDVPCAAANVSAGRQALHTSVLTKVCKVAFSAPVAYRVSHCHWRLSGFYAIYPRQCVRTNMFMAVSLKVLFFLTIL